MLRFDRVLIAPTRADLERVLDDAAKAANKGCRTRKLAWAPADTDSLLIDVAGNREGFRQWNGAGDRKSRGFGQETRSAVAVAWWTDPLKRTHYRVGANRIYCASSDVDHLFCPYRKRPPLWMVYPENVYFRGEEETTNPFVICRCGASGSPKSLGWMGPCCAACHDRAEEEGAPLVPAGEPVRTLLIRRSGWVGPALFTPDGRSVISADRSGARVFTWDLTTGTAREVLSQDTADALAASPDGQTLAAGFSRGEVVLLSLKDGTRDAFTTGSGMDRVLALAFSPDGSLLAAAPFGRAELWDVAMAARPVSNFVFAIPHPGPWDPAPGGRRVVVAEDLRATQAARYLAFSPDGRTLAVAHGGRRGILLWDVASGQGRNLEISGVEYYACGVAFTPDGRILGVITSSPGSVRLVDLASGRVLAAPDFNRARDLAFSPDGRVLAVAGQDGSLRLFSVPDGHPLGVYFWHMQTLNCVAFSPDGRWLATASDDRCVKLWPVPELLRAGFPL